MKGSYSAFLRELRREAPGLRILEEEPLAAHCSFRIGGPCAALLQPSSQEEAGIICRLLRQEDDMPLIMGRGTNLLFPDAPLPRIVLQLGDAFSQIRRDGPAGLFAQAGTSLCRLAAAAADASLTGLEFAHGIPGALGGGISMNAGAYEGEMAQAVRSVLWLNEDLELQESGDLDFSYRHSRFTGTGDVILGAFLSLRPGDGSQIRGRMRELMERRRQSQPLELPSAGSTFKRPAGGYAAALIDEAGLKGFSIGGAKVSEKHAGFVVNAGGASCGDVLRLMEHIQEQVYRRSGILLEPEVRIVRE